jgi:hypothetical protein
MAKDVRVFVRGHFRIFYQIDNEKLIIHLVWDCRQNPETLNINLNYK